MKKFVKVCLHLSYIVQNSFHFDEIFYRKFQFYYYGTKTTSSGNFRYFGTKITLPLQVYWKSKIIGKAIEDLDEVPLVMSNDEISRIENEALIKLFAHACQLEQETRAMDVCKLMTSDGLQLAIKYATKIKRMQLVMFNFDSLHDSFVH